MAKGYDKNQERKQAVSMLGKGLVRRSGSKCELCEASGVALQVYEVPPVNEPRLDASLFICDTCLEAIDSPRRANPAHWRCLTTTMWSELPVVQVMVIRLLQRIQENELWAADLLEQLYPEAEVKEWAAEASI